MFPNRINVQFAKIISRSEAEILIWERGAEFTLASGTSCCAVACVLRKRNLIDNKVKIKMLGGATIQLLKIYTKMFSYEQICLIYF